MRDDCPAVETVTLPDVDGERAPLVVRRLSKIALGILIAGAGYLIAVRRDAILVDLANFAAWCF